jgi:hypothetical protein
MEPTDDATKPLNTLYDASTNDDATPDDVQKRLNTPLAGGQLDPEDIVFKELLLKLVEEKKIEMYRPSSLINDAVYQTLLPEQKAKAEYHATAMLTKIRNIVKLHKADMDTNYQEQNLIHSLRLGKEQLEKENGDIFIF